MKFTYKGQNIIWVADETGGGVWKVGSTVGNKCDFSDGGKIEYTYQTDEPLSRKFVEDTGEITITGGDGDAQN